MKDFGFDEKKYNSMDDYNSPDILSDDSVDRAKTRSKLRKLKKEVPERIRNKRVVVKSSDYSESESGSELVEGRNLHKKKVIKKYFDSSSDGEVAIGIDEIDIRKLKKKNKK